MARASTSKKPTLAQNARRTAGNATPRRGQGVRTVYEAIRQEILEMTLAPGEPLDEVALSDRFVMSRTPIREALVRLAGEGLVTTLPNRNTIVSIIDFAGLPAYFDALTLMHRVTTRAAARTRSRADLELIRQHQADFARSVEERDAQRMITSNREFHVAIAEAGRNPYYVGLFSRLLDEGRRILRLYYWSFDDRLPHQYVEEHDRIIDAIARQDENEAEQLATAHAAQIVEQVRSFMGPGLGATIRLDGRLAAAAPAE